MVCCSVRRAVQTEQFVLLLLEQYGPPGPRILYIIFCVSRYSKHVRAAVLKMFSPLLHFRYSTSAQSTDSAQCAQGMCSVEP